MVAPFYAKESLVVAIFGIVSGLILRFGENRFRFVPHSVARLPLQMASHCRSPDTTVRQQLGVEILKKVEFGTGSTWQNRLSHQEPS